MGGGVVSDVVCYVKGETCMGNNRGSFYAVRKVYVLMKHYRVLNTQSEHYTCVCFFTLTAL